MMAKRSNGEGSIFRTKNGKWKAVISLGFGTGGRRIRKSRVCRSKADAVAALREMSGKVASGVSDCGTSSVSQAIDGWLADVVRHEKAIKTYECYEFATRQHVKPRIGGLRLSKLASVHVQNMVSEMVEAGVGERTRQLAFAVLSVFLQHLTRLRIIPENPCRYVTRPKYSREKIQPFSSEEVRLMLNDLEETRWHALITLAVFTGMRQGEILGLHWEQIQLDSGGLTVDRQAIQRKGSPEISKPKTESSVRKIELASEVVEALLAHKAILLREGLAGSSLVFPTANDGIMDKSRLYRSCWRPLLKRLKLPHRGFHHLRHTFATLALGGGVPVHVVSRMLGHSSPSVTLNIYSHCLTPDQAAASAAMSRILSGGSSVDAFRQVKSS